jgi:integrase
LRSLDWRLATGVTPTLLSEAVKAWVAANDAVWDGERRRLCEGILADFIGVVGDKPLTDYRKSDGRRFVEILRRLPANLEQRRHRLGVAKRDLVKIADAAEAKGLAPQDPANVNKKIGILGQAFKWFAAQFDDCAPNPVEGMRLPQRRSAREAKDAFTIDELNTIFRAPVYTGCVSECHWAEPGPEVLRGSSKFWVPLIGLFTGMRSGEICPLRKSDVREHAGVHYFALTGDARLKTPSSIRHVPIHKTLIDLGFLQFVAACEDRLFADLPQHASGRWSDAFGKHFARFLACQGVKRERLDFHSFRHSFIAAADASGIEFATRERLVGHVLGGQAGRYGKRYAQEAQDMQLMLRRNAELQELIYPGLDLEHLKLRSAA